MDQLPVPTKEELLQEIDAAWAELNAAIDRLSEMQLTQPRDEEGWSAKDHLIHLAAWERSIVFFLQGKPRADGLGVAGSVYLRGDEDEINAAIQQQRHALSTDEARAQLQAVHQELMTLLQPLTDADLQQPYRHYLPDEPGEGDGPPAINLIYGNTADHFREHLGWIETLVDR